jgi:hypothetical protein
MLDKEIEQRINIKFLVKLKETATETFDLLRQAYGENTLSKARVFELHKRFSEGREDVEGDEPPGRPVKIETDENMEKVRTLVRTGRRLNIRMIAEELNTDKETATQILTTDLNKKKVCSKMIPKN